MSDQDKNGATPELEAVLGEVVGERGYQDAKWGESNHAPATWLALLSKQMGQAGEAALLAEVGVSEGVHLLRRELIQIAAVAVAAVEALDRGKWSGAPERQPIPRAEVYVDDDGVLHVDVFARRGVAAVRPSIIWDAPR